MLKIDIIKFEAQDVITASVACSCPTACYPGYVFDSKHHNENIGNGSCTCQAHGSTK